MNESIPRVERHEAVSVVELEKQGAFKKIIDEIGERYKIMDENTEHPFAMPGVNFEHPVDYLVASARGLQGETEKLLMETREANDYRKEQAVAKFDAFVKTYTELVERYAELKTSYPDRVEEIEQLIPALSRGLSAEGERLYAQSH